MKVGADPPCSDLVEVLLGVARSFLAVEYRFINDLDLLVLEAYPILFFQGPVTSRISSMD